MGLCTRVGLRGRWSVLKIARLLHGDMADVTIGTCMCL